MIIFEFSFDLKDMKIEINKKIILLNKFVISKNGAHFLNLKRELKNATISLPMGQLSSQELPTLPITNRRKNLPTSTYTTSSIRNCVFI